MKEKYIKKSLISILSRVLLFTLVLMLFVIIPINRNNDFPLAIALGMEAFISIHMSIFVLIPLSHIISSQNSKKTFWILFCIRALFLLFCDFFITTSIAIIDFFAVFVGVNLVNIIPAIKTAATPKQPNSVTTIEPNQISGIEIKCAKCNSNLKITDKYCTNCGAAFDGDNVVVLENVNATVESPKKVAVLPTNFDKMYSLPEDKMLEEFIKKELTKIGLDKSSKSLPSDLLKKKKILNIIFSFLVFIFITLIFFHFPIYTYIIGLIILFIFYKARKKYDLIKFLKKEVKSRPGEKINNILINAKNTSITDNTEKLFKVSIVISIILPLIIFSTPKILYEKVDGGYAVRYYIFGLTNFKTATIPESYKNENIVSLRGNTFSNMSFLKSVNLPDTITEIRGQAFKNCKRLVEVNIPKKLEYLGGGAFYNAKSIKRIELPDTLTYLGGESFYKAESLEYIKLSNNLTEIRGDSFKYCTSLKSITIPDNVTRIGGHAFYGDSSLSEVVISENSKLTEIGSSAFRQCSKLYNIKIPYRTYVNERAFKESPTIITRFTYS